jgi:hypothetical protein
VAHMPHTREGLYSSSGIHTVKFHGLFIKRVSNIRPFGMHCDKISKIAPSTILDLGIPECLAFIEGIDHKVPSRRDYRDLRGYHHKHPTGLPLMNVLFRTCLLDLDFRLSCRLDDVPEIALELAQGFLLRVVMSYGALMPQDLTQEQLWDLPIPPFDLDFPFLEPGSDLAKGNPRFATYQGFIADAEAKESPLGKFMLRMFDRHLEHFTAGRSLFVTERGYIGLSTNANVQTGDVVAVLMGCRTPVILREHGSEKHNFVSDAFVYGLMDGEAVRGVTMTEESDYACQAGDSGRDFELRRWCIR